MDFWQTVVVLFRRWYVTLPAFLASLGLTAAAYSTADVEYEASSVLVLTSPPAGATTSTDPEHPNPISNPLMTFDRSLALTASVIIQQLRTSEVALSVGVTPESGTTYEINNGTSNPELLESGPFIFVRAVASSPEAAQELAAKVSSSAWTILAERQDALKAPPSTHIEMQVIVAPKDGQPLLGSPLRVAAGAAGLAGLTSLIAVYGFESMMTQRRRARLGDSAGNAQSKGGRARPVRLRARLARPRLARPRLARPRLARPRLARRRLAPPRLTPARSARDQLAPARPASGEP